MYHCLWPEATGLVTQAVSWKRSISDCSKAGLPHPPGACMSKTNNSSPFHCKSCALHSQSGAGTDLVMHIHCHVNIWKWCTWQERKVFAVLWYGEMQCGRELRWSLVRDSAPCWIIQTQLNLGVCNESPVILDWNNSSKLGTAVSVTGPYLEVRYASVAWLYTEFLMCQHCNLKGNGSKVIPTMLCFPFQLLSEQSILL